MRPRRRRGSSEKARSRRQLRCIAAPRNQFKKLIHKGLLLRGNPFVFCSKGKLSESCPSSRKRGGIMETKKDSEALRSEAVRMARVRQLWQASSERHAVQTGILNFSKWLEEHHPELFPPGPGDPY